MMSCTCWLNSCFCCKRRIRRGCRQQDDHALVLLRRQFTAGAAIQKIDAADNQGGERHGHRQRAQAAAQAPFIASLQPAEQTVDQVGEAVEPAARVPPLACGLSR